MSSSTWGRESSSDDSRVTTRLSQWLKRGFFACKVASYSALAEAPWARRDRYRGRVVAPRPRRFCPRLACVPGRGQAGDTCSRRWSRMTTARAVHAQGLEHQCSFKSGHLCVLLVDGGPPCPDFDLIVAQYREEWENWRALAQRLQILLTDLLKAEQITVHAVESRAKSVDSFAEKINRPGKNYTTPLEEVTDLCGIRIIAYYLSDIDRIGEFLRREFDVLEVVDKRKETEPNRFGYLSVHFIVKICGARAELAEWGAYRTMVSEIQVRTVMQHAWAAIEHGTQYKSKQVTPDDLQRDLAILAAQLEGVDESFERLRGKSAVLAGRQSADVQEREYRSAITVDSAESILSLPSVARLSSRIEKLDLFEIDRHSKLTAQSVKLFHEAGCTMLSDLEDRVRRHEDALFERFRAFQQLMMTFPERSTRIRLPKNYLYSVNSLAHNLFRICQGYDSLK